jgi:hypothetical protein
MISDAYLKWLVLTSLATTSLPTLQVEARCLGNVVSLRLQIVQRSLIYLSVMINHTGLYGVAYKLARRNKLWGAVTDRPLEKSDLGMNT